MAFEADLPAGSTPFTNLMYKDPSGKIWAGSERNSEYYRFFDPTDMPYINIKDFGAVGDGVTDDTNAFNNALTAAKASKMSLYFPEGTYPVTAGSDTIDMNGCTGMLGTGELLITETGTDTSKPVIQWMGTKVLVSGGLSGTFNQRRFTINTGLSLRKGDTVYYVSADPFYTDSTVNYKRGFRYTVDQYNPSTGEVVFFEYLPYSITQGWFYWNQDRPKVVISDITIRMITQPDKRGLDVSGGMLFANGVVITGSGRALMVSSSLGRITNCVISVNDGTSGSTGYGIQSAGLSDIYVEGCNVFGYRHGIACGDWGWWRSEDVFETPGSDAYMPSICRVAGSRISGVSYALDSHGGTLLLEAFNCDIYGGAQLGGLETYISDSRIYQNTEMTYNIHLGRDRFSNTSEYQSHYALKNCVVFAKTNFFWVQPDIASVELYNVELRVESDSSPRDMIYYFNDVAKVKKLVINGFRITSPVGETVDLKFKVNNESEINNIDSTNASITFVAADSGETNLGLKNASVRGATGSGVSVIGEGSSDKGVVLLASGLVMDGNQTALTLEGVRSASISSFIATENTASIVINESSVLGKVRLIISNSIIKQASGNVVDGTTEDVDLYQIGNIYEQSSAIANVNQVARYGGYGFNDKLKTVKTVSTASKYGAEAGTGDLSLS